MKLLTVEQYEGIKAALQVGSQDGAEIARQFKVSTSGVYKIHKAIKGGTFDSLVEKAQRFHEGKATHKKAKSYKTAHHSNKTNLRGDALTARIHALHEKDLSYREIGEKLGLSTATVGYYATAREQRNEKKVSPGGLDSPGKEQMNGHHPATNKHILIGIAYAETERFITNLSERIAIPAEVLRRRLAELLGHSPLR